MIDLNATGAGLDGYTLLQAQLESLLADERDFIANASQFRRFCFTSLMT
jgi:L-methionine (R)-S-oxide reductase